MFEVSGEFEIGITAGRHRVGVRKAEGRMGAIYDELYGRPDM
jgi:hypothetical protein